MTVDITCVISTKDRHFSTLPLAINGICQQTCKPKYLIIFDDSFRDLRGEFVYQHLFSLLDFYKIDWRYEPGSNCGQVANHIRSLSLAKTEFIYRLDDDEVPEPDVLEKLIKHIDDKVGAVGGLVIQTNDIKPKPFLASNKIEDIYLGKNEQWYLHENQQPKQVDHLYSSFIYRKSIAEYCNELSVVGHREETILTYGIKLKNYSVILDPSAKTWHFRNPVGGIRSNNEIENYSKDERTFSKKISSWGIKPIEHSYVVLDNGLGDHYVFKHNLDSYFEKYKDKKHIFFVCFPEVFEDIQNIQLASIANAYDLLGDLSKYNLYSFMKNNAWDKTLHEAIQKLYDLPQSSKCKNIIKGKGKTVIISPYSFNPAHAKSYPYWKALIKRLKSLDLHLVQIGRSSEEKLSDIDEYCFDLPFKEIEKRISECLTWISVDNFLQHLVNCMSSIIPGCIIWGVSDPNKFGYSYNKNIFKGVKFLREDQFGPWMFEIKDRPGILRNLERNNNAFEDASIVYNEFKKFLNIQ